MSFTSAATPTSFAHRRISSSLVYYIILVHYSQLTEKTQCISETYNAAEAFSVEVLVTRFSTVAIEVCEGTGEVTLFELLVYYTSALAYIQKSKIEKEQKRREMGKYMIVIFSKWIFITPN